MNDPAQIRAAIAALEAQRPLLGDATTELALTPMRQLLAQAEAGDSTPQLRRAQVTVLFADIVESTALASRLDAEDVLQIFGAMLQRAAACVRARGGRVLRYTGDGLKAGFGTQGTREDDAVNAVQAGLDILAAAREHADWVARTHGVQGFALRVGAHTGEVALGAGFEADNTLTGDTVNIAARMEQAAPPGALRISAETWAHVRGRFDAQAQPPLALKGVDQPMATWLVQAARVGAVARGIEGLAVPMIGRADEQARLLAALQPEPGRGLRAITVVADGGIGKTRLLRETLEIAAPQGARVLTVRAHPGAELRPWGLLHGLLSTHCGIADGDSAADARRKLVAGLASELSDDAEAQSQRIGQLLGMDFGDVPALRGRDARALRDLAFAALLDWLAGLCRTSHGAAVVLVFEDLHWTDEASLDALTHWLDNAGALPLTLLMSTRPALLERRPAWCEQPPTCTRLMLAALPEADRPALADALLQRIDQPPARLRDMLIERAEGNPFYMEELLRRLLDDGAIRREGAVWQVDTDRLDKLRLPTTLVGLLQARLDALPPAERLGAQRASIVGHVFWDDALAQVDAGAPDTLQGLQRRQWVRQRAASAFVGTAERQFDHHLLHQVTYDTVLKEDRRQGHAAVAHWLAARTEGRAPEFLAITGEHAERAGEMALALACYDRAAQEAADRFANALAIECLRKATRLVPQGEPRRRHDLLERLHGLFDLLADRDGQAAVLAEQALLLAAHPDAVAQAQWAMNQAMLADRLGELDRAFGLATEALALAAAAENWDISAHARLELCWLHQTRGELDAAEQHLDAARHCAAQVRETVPLREIQVLQLTGILAGRAGRYRDAAGYLEQALALGEPLKRRRSMIGTLDHLIHALCNVGDHDRALEASNRMVELAREQGDRRGLKNGHRHRAWAWNEMEDYERARDEMVPVLEGLRGSQGSSDDSPIIIIAGTLGWSLDNLGEAKAARQAYEEAYLLCEALDPGSLDTLSARAWVCSQDLILGDSSTARVVLDQMMSAIDRGESLGSTEAEMWTRLVCWRLLSGLGDSRAGPWLAASQARVLEFVSKCARTAQETQHIIQQVSYYRMLMAAQWPADAPG